MIAGIDPSTASLGLALADGTLRTVKPRAKADDPFRRLDELEREVIRTLRLAPPLPALVLIEDKAPHAPGLDATLAVHAVRSTIGLALYRLGIPVLLVGPSRLKRYATGNGNAPKEKMIEAANLERALDGRGPVTNDDEADAYWLRHLGRAGYGMADLDHRAPHRLEIVADVVWPHLPGLGR